MKKIIAMLLVVVTLFLVVSCGLSRKPEDFKEALEKKYGKDIEVELTDDEDEIELFAMLFGLDADGVTAVLAIELELDDDEEGYVIYCEDSKTAKNMKADCEELIDDYDIDYIVQQSGNNIFVGSEELWKAIKGV